VSNELIGVLINLDNDIYQNMIYIGIKDLYVVEKEEKLINLYHQIKDKNLIIDL
jgi:hypothetical protein